MNKNIGFLLLLVMVIFPFKSRTTETGHPKSFSLIVASDVQLVSADAYTTPPKIAFDYNISRVRAGIALSIMNSLIQNSRNTDSPIIGCIVNGDMAEGPKPDSGISASTIEGDYNVNYQDFMLGYDNSYSNTMAPRSSDLLLYNNKLTVPVLPGMGNHDIDTSTDTNLTGWDNISNVIRDNNYNTFDIQPMTCIMDSQVTSQLSLLSTAQAELQGLSHQDIYEVYYTDIGNWRFIQTNWGMTDQKYNKLVAIMEDAAQNQLNIVICGHYFLDDDNAEGVTQMESYFMQMATDSNKAEEPFLPYLKAFMCGHMHDLIGYNMDISIQQDTDSSQEESHTAPLYYNGCSGWFNASFCTSPLHFTVFTFTDDAITGTAYNITQPYAPYLESGATDTMITDTDLSKLPAGITCDSAPVTMN